MRDPRFLATIARLPPSGSRLAGIAHPSPHASTRSQRRAPTTRVRLFGQRDGSAWVYIHQPPRGTVRAHQSAAQLRHCSRKRVSKRKTIQTNATHAQACAKLGVVKVAMLNLFCHTLIAAA